MTGYDFDGVYQFLRPPAGTPHVVISGSLANDWNRVVSGVGPGVPIYLRPFGEANDRHAAGKWKGQMIQQFQDLDVFYEDDPIQANWIRFIVGDGIKIMMVSGGKVTGEYGSFTTQGV